MAVPIIGKVEFKRTAGGQTLLTVDPDSTWELLKVQMPGSPNDILMMITTDDRITLINDRYTLMPSGQLGLGGKGGLGGVWARDPQGNTTASLFGNGVISAGGVGQAGSVRVTNSSGPDLINSTVVLNGQDGQVEIRNNAGQPTILLNGSAADLFLGGANQAGTVVLRNGAGKDMIRLEGQTGDINLLNADCAEDFDISASEEVEPGTVMVINEAGELQPSKDAYDKRVAGVLSGAGDCRPGIVLDKKPSHHHRLPVALIGKVYCKVDAQYSAITVGDLLTTSPTPGHAMKARDPLRAFGAVIGKALRPLHEGSGLIPILIALQ